MKKRKILCITTIVILSVFYMQYAWIESVIGLMLLTLLPGPTSISAIVLMISSVLFLLAPLISVAGIVISIVQLKRDKFGAAFIIQFLPVFTTVHAVSLFLASIIFGKG